MLRIKAILSRNIDLLSSVDTSIRALSIDLGDDGIGKHGGGTGIRKSLLCRKVDNVDIWLVAVRRKGGCRVGGGCVLIRDWKRNLVRSHGRNRNRFGGSLIIGLLSGSDIAFIVASRGL